jgi:hypothetical protein
MPDWFGRERAFPTIRRREDGVDLSGRIEARDRVDIAERSCCCRAEGTFGAIGALGSA